MAHVQYSRFTGYEGHDTDGSDDSIQSSNLLTSLAKWGGAALSVALLVAISIWGVKLIVRDVTGIPVVRALEGDMRVRPEDPGGQLASNAGLSVNEVAAGHGSVQPAQTTILAPAPIELNADDLGPTTDGAAPLQQPQEVEVALTTDELPDPVPAVSTEAAQLDQLAREISAAVGEALSEDPDAAAPVVDAPGLRRSLRPQLRIDDGRPQARAEPIVTREVDPASILAGTRLVQLGAFDTAEVARNMWGGLETSFADYLRGKDRVVQQTTSGGRTFYRLRAAGFADLSDARRFCSALLAEGVECIPVVAR